MISPIKKIFVLGIDIFREIGYFIISGRGKFVLDVSLGGTDIRHLPDTVLRFVSIRGNYL
jgi:hypothetical protein